MTLLEQVNEDLKQAMRDKEVLKLSVLRMLVSSVRNKEIAGRGVEGVEVNDQMVQEVLASEVKKRQDSIESFSAAGRVELADKETEEMEILKKYLPAQLTEVEVEAIVREIIKSAETKDFGSVMKQAMTELKGKADGKKIGELIKKILAE